MTQNESTRNDSSWRARRTCTLQSLIGNSRYFVLPPLTLISSIIWCAGWQMLSCQSGILSPETKRPPFGGETPSGGLTATLVLEGSWLSWLIFPIRPDLKVRDAIAFCNSCHPHFPQLSVSVASALADAWPVAGMQHFQISNPMILFSNEGGLGWQSQLRAVASTVSDDGRVRSLLRRRVLPVWRQ